MPSEDLSYHAYWTHVSDLVDEIIEESEGDEGRKLDLVDEMLDQDEWVIYYHKAPHGLLHSENESAFFEVGDPREWESWEDANTQMMFWALRADVMDRLRRR